MKNIVAKKRIVIVAAFSFCLVIGGIIGGIALTNDTEAKEDTVTIVDTETGEEKVVDADSKEAKEAEENEDVEVVANDSKEDKSSKNQTSENNNGNKSNNSNANNNSNSNSGGNSNNSGGTKPSNNSGNSNSGNSNSGGTKPSHTHSWSPVYVTQEVQVPYSKSVVRCTGCGADVGGNAVAHISASANDNCHGYKEYSETAYRTEYQQVYSHDACSCGQTR